MGRLENPFLVRGIRRYSRNRHHKRVGTWRKKVEYKNTPKKVVEKPEEPIRAKYVEDHKKKHTKCRRSRAIVHRLRPGIEAGSVLILVAGRFEGRRVVFLKQLASGALLVTGPKDINGVPLRRVDQAFVIPTSTKVDISGVSIPDGINDALFKKPKKKRVKKSEADFFKSEPKTAQEADPRLAEFQASVDAGVTAAVNATPLLAEYLAQKFGLGKGQYPHLMKF